VSLSLINSVFVGRGDEGATTAAAFEARAPVAGVDVDGGGSELPAAIVGGGAGLVSSSS